SVARSAVQGVHGEAPHRQLRCRIRLPVECTHAGATPSRFPTRSARARRSMGRDPCQRAVAVYGRRVFAWNAARMASRRADVRPRNRYLACRTGPDAVPSVPPREADTHAVADNRAGAALDLRPARRRALALAACDLAHQGAALFHHVPDDGPGERRTTAPLTAGGTSSSGAACPDTGTD